ncbi:transposase [Patescibacteria group bacterium]|nr:transposase [Patescibacteria group bacterium]
MINIERALKDSRLMLALTGVTPQEFQNLIPAFSQAWLEEKRKQHRKDSKERKLGGGRIGFLKTMEGRLFFILFYYKCYPTYDVLGFVYACNRSNACRRQFNLSDVIEKTLGKKLTLPERRMKKIEDFFKAFPEAREVFIDGTERPIQRPKDKERQRANYSGKKKRHTRKNLVIGEKNKRIGFLSKTVEGKKHDFTLLKEEAPPENMPPKIKKHLDLGFKGMQQQFPEHAVSMPKRKPRTKDLTPFSKEQNKKKSSVRVLIENALAGVKRLRITTDTFRNRKKNFDDQTMLISCGLWNYHLATK